VKLAEMLGKGIWNRATTLGDHEDKPNAYRTSVCCLVMLLHCKDNLNLDCYLYSLHMESISMINFNKFMEDSKARGSFLFQRQEGVQLLREICEMSMPFARVLGTIREVIEQAIYSKYMTLNDGASFGKVLTIIFQAPPRKISFGTTTQVSFHCISSHGHIFKTNLCRSHTLI
jgi:hypothetical protein